MMSEINREQAHAVAALVAALRPEWDTPGILKALSDARDRGTAWDVAHAALHAAENPRAKTPAIIALAGEHWTKGKELGAAEGLRTPRCDVVGHGSYFAHNCGACKADRVEATTALAHQAPRTPPVPTERVRQILAGATRPEPDHHHDARTRAAGKD